MSREKEMLEFYFIAVLSLDGLSKNSNHDLTNIQIMGGIFTILWGLWVKASTFISLGITAVRSLIERIWEATDP